VETNSIALRTREGQDFGVITIDALLVQLTGEVHAQSRA
jgi:hypothetical protein